VNLYGVTQAGIMLVWFEHCNLSKTVYFKIF